MMKYHPSQFEISSTQIIVMRWSV